MADTFDSSTGEVVAAPDLPVGTSKVSVQNPTSGEFQLVSPKTARHLLAQGFKLDTPELRTEIANQEKYGDGFGNEAAAFGLGAARGASFGLSDLALSETGLLSADELKQREELNPDASLAGEAASFLLPAAGAVKALGTAGKVARGLGAGIEGASLVGKGVEAAGQATAKALGIEGTSLLGQVGAKMLPRAAGIAAEGELYNIGHNLSQAVMKDQPVTVESLMANSGDALALGAGLGLAGPLAARAGRSIVDKIAPEIVQTASASINKAANNAVKKVADFFDPENSLQLFSGLRANTPERFAQDVKVAREAGFYRPGEVKFDPESLSFKQIAKGGLPDREAASLRLEQGKADVGKAMGNILSAGEGVKFSDNIKRFGMQDAKRMSKLLTDWRANRVITDQEAGQLGALVNDIGAAVNEKAGDLKGLHELRMGLDQRIGGKNWETLKGEEIETIKELRRIVADKIDAGASALAEKGLVKNGDWKKLNRLYGSLAGIEKPLAKAQAQANAWVNVGGLRWRDLMLSGVGAPVGASVGGMIGGEDGAKVGGILGGGLGVANKLFQTEKGLLWRAQIGERLGALQGAAGALSNVSERISSAAAKFVGNDTTRMAARTVPFRLETAFSSAQDKRAEKIAARDRQDKYRVAFDKLSKLVADPMQTGEEITKAMRGAEHLPPGIREALVGKQLETYNFLAMKAPRDPLAEYNVNPTQSQYEPSDGEIATWERYVRAAQAPLTVIDDLHKGEVTPEAAEAVRTLYPKLYQNMQIEIMQHVTESKRPLPYEERAQLGIMFDVPADPSLAPEFLNALQGRFEQSGQPSDGSSKTRVTGTSKMDAGNVATVAQAALNK